MSRHAARRAPSTSGRLRGSTVGLLAAAIAPLAGFTLVAPALADTTAPDAANAAGSALGLPSLPGDTPVVDVDLPDVCLDLSAKVDKAQADLDAAPGNVALQGVLASAKLALGDCVDKATDPTTTTPTPTTTTPTTTTPAPSTTTTLPPLGGALGGTEPGSSTGPSTSERIPADADAESQADRQGSNTQVVIPRGAADTGDGSFPQVP